VAGPKETHETALAARREELAELEKKAGGIASARLVVFLVAIGVLAAVVFVRTMPPGSWLGVVAALVAFGALVVVHARIHARKDEKQAAVRFHERALARMAGKWRTFMSTGAKWAVETHPYAGDLDVFGRASLFQLLDATSTRYGEEVLARWLSGEDAGAEFYETIAKRQAAVKDLADRLKLREELAVVGSLLDDEKKPDPRPFVMWAGQSADKETGPLSPSLTIAAIILPALTITALVLSGMGLAPRFTFIVPFVVEIAVLTTLRPRMHKILEAASSKESALSRYAGMLALLENEKFEAPALQALQSRLKESGASATNEMASLSRIVGFLDARNNEVFKFFIGPALMWDLWCALALDKWRKRAGKAAFGWFRALAELEALASLAGFAFERPDHTFPELGEDATFRGVELGHPLIEADKRVSNDVTIDAPGHALVVTGSNMSGKSTLLRAIGVNAVLANAGAPVCAKRLVLGRLRVATSMRVSDSLEEGTSRFYAELKKLKLVLDLAKKAHEKGGKDGTVLFLLDEILHGTNTRERLIGARAILKELVARGAMGAVSTHDLGLGDLEKEMPDRVKNVHFEEQVKGEEMSFDYLLRTGIVQSSNALRLMKIVGLDVVSPDAS
jgi:ABC-type multidrug transport system fused ATPase/permease subunit